MSGEQGHYECRTGWNWEQVEEETDVNRETTIVGLFVCFCWFLFSSIWNFSWHSFGIGNVTCWLLSLISPQDCRVCVTDLRGCNINQQLRWVVRDGSDLLQLNNATPTFQQANKYDTLYFVISFQQDTGFLASKCNFLWEAVLMERVRQRRPWLYIYIYIFTSSPLSDFNVNYE